MGYKLKKKSRGVSDPHPPLPQTYLLGKKMNSKEGVGGNDQNKQYISLECGMKKMFVMFRRTPRGFCVLNVIMSRTEATR